MQQLLLIAVAGALGALCRYGITLGSARVLGDRFPYGTFTANVLGCCALGFVISAGLSGHLIPKAARIPIATGFLGALTTFSTFSYETARYLEIEAYGLAMANVLLNLFVGGAATFLGLYLGRTFG